MAIVSVAADCSSGGAATSSCSLGTGETKENVLSGGAVGWRLMTEGFRSVPIRSTGGGNDSG
jgi:hypothetical protein